MSLLASLLRPSQPRAKGRRSALAAFSPFNRNRQRSRYAESASSEEQDEAADEQDRYEEGEDEDDGDYGEDEPLLPIFSAEHLDRLPIYNVTHALRLLVLRRCETTLSWDQLRSPQISQFLVKPIQQEIRSAHFSRATLYALIANCLQFQKEGQLNPGNIGVSRTRAMICELLAMRLLKEFSTRELIDALSYDFDPLQGLQPSTGSSTPGFYKFKAQARAARISTIEIAIRAQAKRFLAHPLVVQQLEAIWAGTIVFHSTADSLHRKPPKQNPNIRGPTYGAIDSQATETPANAKQRNSGHSSPPLEPTIRRSVTLYDPRDASLFKLSRLRVPRYRQIFSTCSFAMMLGLFLAVLVERSLDITALEIVFWFWSAGFMLDEIVGFSEQGFGLYIMSVWNAFDLGILLLFVVYYVLRLYGILMPDVRKHYTADMAYDVLASTAVLLFPRLFSVLDHYRYFSQLLIAFRMMAMDLVAILILIIISCSGFFVAFTLSFGGVDFSAADAAYALFQMLMGFTPAAWDIWGSYNLLGKSILTLFLFICHFLIVTILITVLTNSFMAIVQNANEEHQFLFAVNTISMVKSDALFSYIAPTNVFGWLLVPFRLVLPFRQFVRLNRTMIKLTHFPILWSIFAYERLILSQYAYEPTELVERRGRSSARVPAFSIRGVPDIFSPGTRLREPSVTTFHKDRALDEVFRRPYKDDTLRVPNTGTVAGRRKSSHVVHNWMNEMGNEGGASPPSEEPRSVLDRLEHRRPMPRRARTSQRLTPIRRNVSIKSRSVASDPEDVRNFFSTPHAIQEEDEYADVSMEELHQATDADGDDELVTNDDESHITLDRLTGNGDANGSDKESRYGGGDSDEEDYFTTPLAAKPPTPAFGSASSANRSRFVDVVNTPTMSRQAHPRRPHNRNLSTNTVLFSPVSGSRPTSRPQSRPQSRPISRPQSRPLSPQPDEDKRIDSSRSASPHPFPPSVRSGIGSGPRSNPMRSGTATPGRRTPRRPVPQMTAIRPRPILPPRGLNQLTPDIAGFFALDRNQRERKGRREPSFNAMMALDLASDLGDNRELPNIGAVGALPASFSTQLEMAAMARKWQQQRRKDTDDEGTDSGMMGRLMLARMTTLEEGFREVLKEVRGIKSKVNSDAEDAVGMKRRGKKKREAKRKTGSDEGVKPHVDIAEEGSVIGRSSV